MPPLGHLHDAHRHDVPRAPAHERLSDDYRVRHTGWSDWLRRNPKVLGQVKAAVSARGPMGNAEFEGRWWNRVRAIS